MFWLFPALFWDSGLDRSGLTALSYVWLIAAVPGGLALFGMFREKVSDQVLRIYDLAAVGTMGAALAAIPWAGGLSGLTADSHYLLALAHMAASMGYAMAPRSGRHSEADLPVILTNGISYVAAFTVINRPVMIVLIAMISLVAVVMVTTSRRAMNQLESLRADSEHRAVHDGLTGLLNRDGFIEHLDKTTSTAASTLAPVEVVEDACGPVDQTSGSGTSSYEVGDWLVLLDLVGFKQVNDRFGHSAGDMVLTEVGQRLRGTLPGDSMIARLASDEFAFTVNGSSLNGLECTLGRLLNIMSEPYEHERGSSEVSASVGTTILRPNATAAALMAEADLAMYESKKTKSSHVTHYDQSLKEQFDTRIDVEARLRAALDNREIEFWAQPIVLSNNLRPTGVELLARWRLPDGSYESPGVFIPIAEETGLVVELGRQALQYAASLLERWGDDPELKDVGVNVNVAASHLTDGLLDDVIAVQPQGDHRLGIEFVESQLILNHERTQAEDWTNRLEEFKRRRYRLLIDDFGTGYSSLSYLWAIPLSAIKIDRSLVMGVENDRTKAGLLTATVAMARELQVPCVAEGVETDEAIDALNKLGVPVLQGFGIAKPRPVPETEVTLRRLIRAARSSQQEMPDANAFVRSLEQLNADGFGISVEETQPGARDEA